MAYESIYPDEQKEGLSLVFGGFVEDKAAYHGLWGWTTS